MVISDDVIAAEKSVELDGVKFFRADVGSHTVHDEVEIVLKLLDLRIVSILATIFDRQRMKLKDIEQHSFIRFSRLLHIDPDHRRLILQQLGKIRRGKVFLNLRNALAIDENLHAWPLLCLFAAQLLTYRAFTGKQL